MGQNIGNTFLFRVSISWLAGFVFAIIHLGICLPFFAQEDDAHPLDLRPQPWGRRAEPILSANQTQQEWSRVTLYSPHVIRVGDAYRMYYIGNHSATRTPDLVMGIAESEDGIHWTEFAGNPILTLDDLPWGSFWQTPFVLHDEEEDIYKMWFVSVPDVKLDERGRMKDGNQQVGYATSSDGIKWDVHPEPILEYGRRPCVLKEGPRHYRMWMNSGPVVDGKRTGLLKNIYEFVSEDGINWTQSDSPALQPDGEQKTVVYPWVVQENGKYFLWHASHVPGGHTELFCAESTDGSNWMNRHEKAAFPASRDSALFDGRYTSTPCVLVEKDRYLLYYSARDLENTYLAGDGTVRRDGAGVYEHIGVAVIPRVD